MLQPLHQQQGQEAEVGLSLQAVPGAGLVVEVHLVQYSTVQYNTVQYSKAQYSTVQYRLVEVHLVLLQHGQLGLQPLGRLHPRLLHRVLLDEAGVDLVRLG